MSPDVKALLTDAADYIRARSCEIADDGGAKAVANDGMRIALGLEALSALTVLSDGEASEPAGWLMTNKADGSRFYASAANVEFWKQAGHTAQPLYLAASPAPPAVEGVQSNLSDEPSSDASDGASPAADVAMVHRICPYLRDGNDCNHCPPEEEVHGEMCVRGCYALAEEAVNIAQTGNPWRRSAAGQSLIGKSEDGSSFKKTVPAPPTGEA